MRLYAGYRCRCQCGGPCGLGCYAACSVFDSDMGQWGHALIGPAVAWLFCALGLRLFVLVFGLCCVFTTCVDRCRWWRLCLPGLQDWAVAIWQAVVTLGDIGRRCRMAGAGAGQSRWQQVAFVCLGAAKGLPGFWRAPVQVLGCSFSTHCFPPSPDAQQQASVQQLSEADGSCHDASKAPAHWRDALGWVAKRISPLAQQRPDETPGLALGFGCMGPGSEGA